MDFEKRLKEKELIKQNTRTPRLIAYIMIVSIGVMALLAYTVRIDPDIPTSTLETLYGLAVFLIILILIAILSVRKTLYYSTRYIKENDTLEDILRKWARIDILLMSAGVTIPILGLLITWMGTPFNRTGFIFVVSAILMVILLPVGIKIRGKLEILRKHIEGI